MDNGNLAKPLKQNYAVTIVGDATPVDGGTLCKPLKTVLQSPLTDTLKVDISILSKPTLTFDGNALKVDSRTLSKPIKSVFFTVLLSPF